MIPFFREAGAGPGVVCLHSNASSSGQWRGLMERLAAKFHVFAPDAYGAGKGPPWPTGRRVTLRDEVVDFGGLGHMGPVTHPEIVNEAIARFLEEAQ